MNQPPEHLIDKYLNGQCTPEEKQMIEDWYEQFDANTTGFYPDDSKISDSAMRTLSSLRNKIALIKQVESKGKTISIWSRLYANVYYISAAAIAVIVLMIALFNYQAPEVKSGALTSDKPNGSDQPIEPGGNKATLMLADGAVIDLESAADGTIVTQGSMRIIKQQDGEVVYRPMKPVTSETVFNTISTPRGGQYTLQLSDGSTVWLNAASSLRFPSAFTGPDRPVELKGEAYFKVAKNSAMPFKVMVNDQVIEVLGTEFNVMACSDEKSMKTTLIEGSVKIKSAQRKAANQQQILLKPGQQAEAVSEGSLRLITEGNINQAIAWKQGMLDFRDEELSSIMRKISRWYNVDVEYEGNISEEQFGGLISRREDVREVLKLLEMTGAVHFKIENRKIIVMP